LHTGKTIALCWANTRAHLHANEMGNGRRWIWGWGARSCALVQLSDLRSPRVGDAKHHLTPVAPFDYFLFWPGQNAGQATLFRPARLESPRCPSTPACLTKERESPHIKAFGATLANSSASLAAFWPELACLIGIVIRSYSDEFIN